MRRLPALLAVLNSLFLFFPFRERLIGLGDDPFFNLWTLEYDWKVISRSGPWELFFEKGWAAPIFHPFPLGLALSENQVYLALLSWPIRALSGNGTWTMNFLAFLMNLAAFVFASLWLKSIGVKRLHMWGGLLFAACGWVQSHSAHYQNICVFVLPLALWLWARMMERPSVGPMKCWSFVPACLPSIRPSSRLPQGRFASLRTSSGATRDKEIGTSGG